MGGSTVSMSFQTALQDETIRRDRLVDIAYVFLYLATLGNLWVRAVVLSKWKLNQSFGAYFWCYTIYGNSL